MASVENQAENRQVGTEVCVIGTGVIGLATCKNLLEQGLQVTAFERYPHIGGTWHISNNPEQTTALEWTKFNNSKEAATYTDFPFPEGDPMHPSTRTVERYLESYVDHFNLRPHIQLSTSVDYIERDEEHNKWLVYTRNANSGEEKCRAFDRVAVATGVFNTLNMPDVKGIENFAGETVHSREFKDPQKYEGKNVLVVGASASGSDTTGFLVRSKASKVYISHRSQFYVVPRVIEGKAFDHVMTRRVASTIRFMFQVLPRVFAAVMNAGLSGVRKKNFPWLSKHPSFAPPRKIDGIMHRVPFITDNFPHNLRDGHVESVQGIQEITGPKSVTLTDGRVLEGIDAIIFCTGYHFDFSIVRGAGNPTDPSLAPDHYKRIEATKFYNPTNKFPRLFMGFLSEQYPESLAFMGHVIILKPAIAMYDLVSMALSSVWAGAYPIASADERRKDIDTQYNFAVNTLNRGPLPHLGIRGSMATYNWLNRAAGTGLTERLGNWVCGYEAWKLWWSDRKLYYLLMDGFEAPAQYRLFDTGRGRKPWPGARAHIEHVNASIKEKHEAWKREQKEKKKK